MEVCLLSILDEVWMIILTREFKYFSYISMMSDHLPHLHMEHNMPILSFMFTIKQLVHIQAKDKKPVNCQGKSESCSGMCLGVDTYWVSTLFLVGPIK